MKVVAILPPSEQVQAQITMVRALFPGHTVELATNAEELEPHLTDCEVLISTAFTPITHAMLEKAGRLRFIQVAGVGVDHVDLDTARQLGITVAAVSGANTVSVAEHVVMVTLAMIRGLIPAHTMLARGEWSLPYWIAHARDLQGKTVGIVGMGRIGREVATRLLPFGVTTFYYDVNPLLLLRRARRAVLPRASGGHLPAHRAGAGGDRLPLHGLGRRGHAPPASNPRNTRTCQSGATEAHEIRRLPDQHRARRAGRYRCPHRSTARTSGRCGNRCIPT
ncbi:MAG: hypothetical protein C4336_06750 [Armatimonadota bacterium]